MFTENASLSRMNHSLVSNSARSKRVRSLLWYILFGFLHEFVHIIAALLLGLSQGIWNDGFFLVTFRTVMGRFCVVPALQGKIEPEDEWRASVVQHSGWIASTIFALAIWINIRTKQSYPKKSEVLFAACITAAEALTTDLLNLGCTIPHSDVLYCGNFGLILLNNHWVAANNGKFTLDILEHMANVTMMRGAQSGGVVTFVKSKRTSKGSNLIGVRSRILNAKRTDLSKKIREKVQR